MTRTGKEESEVLFRDVEKTQNNLQINYWNERLLYVESKPRRTTQVLLHVPSKPSF